MKRRSKIGIALVLVLLLMAVSASAVGAGPRSAFVGRWQDFDIPGDGSTNTLSINQRGRGDFNLRWRETYFSLCDGDPGIGLGTGNETAPNVLESNFDFYCKGKLTLTINITFTYDDATDTLASDAGGILGSWDRIAGPPGP